LAGGDPTRSRLAREEGQALVEYALIISFAVAVGLVPTATVVDSRPSHGFIFFVGSADTRDGWLTKSS
jgi:hypothetical protein